MQNCGTVAAVARIKSSRARIRLESEQASSRRLAWIDARHRMEGSSEGLQARKVVVGSARAKFRRKSGMQVEACCRAQIVFAELLPLLLASLLDSLGKTRIAWGICALQPGRLLNDVNAPD